MSAPVTPLLLIYFLYLGSLSALSQNAGPCPMRIQAMKSGELFTNRFNGRYKTSPNLLERDLKGGCYNDANPSPVSSVTLSIAPGTPTERVKLLYEILERNGWPKARIKVVPSSQ
ncbi:MAG: hypothetical protein ABR889_02750 [Acidobacteriaceae bacterium]|jgi:hypothetical protein